MCLVRSTGRSTGASFSIDRCVRISLYFMYDSRTCRICREPLVACYSGFWQVLHGRRARPVICVVAADYSRGVACGTPCRLVHLRLTTVNSNLFGNPARFDYASRGEIWRARMAKGKVRHFLEFTISIRFL
jgi:hypothetical protein